MMMSIATAHAAPTHPGGVRRLLKLVRMVLARRRHQRRSPGYLPGYILRDIGLEHIGSWSRKTFS